MNESNNGKKIDLRPVGFALGHMAIYEDGSVLINPAMISHWTVDDDGTVFLHMSTGRDFSLNHEQAENFIKRVNEAIELTRDQAERLIVPAAQGRGM